eukprot:CAMPEP_0205935190 /NCGR_PEP_ID=MMETSP1325-20131115/38415_1 /ASSEMBLY_ACC=CAM_ASM_000708 /TAXON_ID=236786 /ORGANISM="Florenciella sp., Strain RCC1007" /LENGTH=48 /DNA_ID= /DNA_START= /DNA_END= /DNA_ORIENTATION=
MNTTPPVVAMKSSHRCRTASCPPKSHAENFTPPAVNVSWCGLSVGGKL